MDSKFHGRPEKIKFTCQVECYIGSYPISMGDTLIARDLGDGLYALSGSWQGSEEFAHLDARDINRLAKMELIEPEAQCSCLERLGDTPTCQAHWVGSAIVGKICMECREEKPVKNAGEYRFLHELGVMGIKYPLCAECAEKVRKDLTGETAFAIPLDGGNVIRVLNGGLKKE